MKRSFNGLPEVDVNLDAWWHRSLRRSWLMCPARVSKGKAKAVETVVEDDEVSEDEDAALNWGA